MWHSLLTPISKPIAQGFEAARGTIGGLTWGPALVVAKSSIEAVLRQIEVGTLVLVDEPSGRRLVFGQKTSIESSRSFGPSGDAPDQRTNGFKIGSKPPRNTKDLRVELRVKRDAFWMRLLLFADMGFAESYMLGDFECDDLTTFFQLFIVNRDKLGDGTTRFSSISSAVTSLARTTNALGNALLNISAHYDISNEMFAAFLSPDMTYSCPIWKTVGPGEATAEECQESLEEAQMTKLHRFIHGARIKSTDHVLEIGTGWGSFAIEAVRTTGCRITSLTLSREQKALAEERISVAGLSDRIQVLLMDYREMPVPEQKFDKIVSIEMIEAVGEEFLSTYFACIHRLLKNDGGIAVFQAITMPEGRHEAYSKREDFINKYIFPGGYLPSTTQLLHHISRESHGTLIVERVENIGGHYTKTLRLWRENFLSKFDASIRPALKKEHADMTEQEIDVFRRKWEYYFTYCEAGFLTKTLGDAIITVGREGATELMEGIPL